MTEETYYDILGVEKVATENDIKRQYKTLALKWHPDKHPLEGRAKAEEEFKKIHEAYSVLVDPEKRKLYDTYGKTRLDNNSFGEYDAFDLFNQMFNTMGHDNDSIDIENVMNEIELSLEQMYTGCNIKCKIERSSLCTSCNGTGINKSVGLCKGCNGCRMYKEIYELKVSVPKGVYEEYQIVIENEGHQVFPEHVSKYGSSRSKAVFIVKAKQHDTFERYIMPEKGKPDFSDLIVKLVITFGESIVGFNKSIKHLDGIVKNFCMLEPCRHNDMFVLKGCGMPKLNHVGEYGDLFISIHVSHPNKYKLSKTEKLSLCSMFETNMPEKKQNINEFIPFEKYKIEAKIKADSENMKQQYERRKKNKSTSFNPFADTHPNTADCVQQLFSHFFL